MLKPLVVAVTALALAGCPGRDAGVVEAPVPATPDQVVRAATGLLEQYRQAFEVRSFEALEPLYSHTLDLSVTHQGKTYSGWSQVERYLNELLGQAAQVHVTFDDTDVAALGNGGAAVHTAVRREISDGTTAVIEEGTLTLALRREGEAWVIVKEHFSYPPGTE